MHSLEGFLSLLRIKCFLRERVDFDLENLITLPSWIPEVLIFKLCRCFR